MAPIQALALKEPCEVEITIDSGHVLYGSTKWNRRTHLLRVASAPESLCRGVSAAERTATQRSSWADGRPHASLRLNLGADYVPPKPHAGVFEDLEIAFRKIGRLPGSPWRLTQRRVKAGGCRCLVTCPAAARSTAVRKSSSRRAGRRVCSPSARWAGSSSDTRTRPTSADRPWRLTQRRGGRRRMPVPCRLLSSGSFHGRP